MLNKTKSIILILGYLFFSHTSYATMTPAQGMKANRMEALKTITQKKYPSKVEAASSAVFAALDQTLSVARQGLSEQDSQVASGEGQALNAAWSNGFAGSTKDSNNNHLNDRFNGVSVGYQKLVCDDLVVGMAASMINFHSKVPAVSNINTTISEIEPLYERSRVKTIYYIGSLYIANKMGGALISGAAFAGAGRGKVKSGDEKIKDSVYGMQAALEYEIAVKKHLIIPALSIRWLDMDSKRTSNILTTRTRSGIVLNGSAEIKYACKIINDNMSITPSVSVGLNNNFSNSLKQDDEKLKVKSGPTTKLFTAFNLATKGNIVELCIGGKHEMAEQFSAYTAAVSVLAKF